MRKMSSPWPTMNPRKRKRRRGLNRPAIHAQLVLDESLKNDIGLLAKDIFDELFPLISSLKDEETTETDNNIKYVAIAPHTTSSNYELDTARWTIVAVKRHDTSSTKKQLPHNSLQFSATSHTLGTFIESVRKDSKGRSSSHLRTPIDIQILDAVPIPLDTIYVAIDGAALAKIDDANQQYNYMPHWRGESTSAVGLNSTGEGRRRSSSNKSRPQIPSSRWETTIRQALKVPRIVHAGGLLALPLPSHPITHKPPPPAKITMCEPVAQGLLHKDTHIVITETNQHIERLTSPILSFPPINVAVLEEEDSANEQFHSAAEDKIDSIDSTPVRHPPKKPNYDGLDIDDGSDDDIDNLSDDSGDTVGLSLPTLPTQASGMASAFTSATPRLGLGQMNGIASPGSILSGFSTSTARGNRAKGRVFETLGLLARIPDSELLPKPSSDEDEEARVYMDTSSLVKIGCFSGDWVRIEPTTDTQFPNLSSWGLGAFDSAAEEAVDWRAVKVFALPGQYQQRIPRYAINKSGSRRSSISSLKADFMNPKVRLSPILLSNLGNPTHLRIASLAQSRALHGLSRSIPKSRITSNSLPPFAKEVTLVRLSTPLATERNLQSILLVGLRNYFEYKRRVVKNGDLFAISIDENVGKALYQGTAGEDESEQNELLVKATIPNHTQEGKSRTNVAWFKIRSVIAEPTKGDLDPDTHSMWGGISIVRPGYSGMLQAGSEQGKLPQSISSTWQYYLGVKRLSSTEFFSIDWDGNLPKPPVSQLRRRLRELISAATSTQAIHLGLPPLAVLLVSTQRHIGKSTTAIDACTDLGLHTFTIDAYDILTEGGSGGGDVKTEAFLKVRAERALTCGAEYTALLVRHIDVLNADRMTTALKEILADSRVLIATTADVEKVPEGVRGIFTHEIELNAPDEREREALLQSIIQDSGIPMSPSVDLSSVAIKTAALVAGDLVDVVERAVVARSERLENLAELATERNDSEDMIVSVRDIEIAGGDASRNVIKGDFDVAVDAARKNFADAIGAPKIPNVTWDDVGGLTNVKDAVMETIQLPLERPELFAKGMKKRSGILFYGPPGTGKTLLAKAIATEFSLNFFSVKGPELLNMYIGESEANVRRVFQRARDARPCVVFFDELDSVAPKRGNQGDSGGVMDRIVSQLLAELDGMSTGEDGNGGGVFVIGATNRPDLLDQALLRPGRFDKMLYLGVSETHEGQLTILKALTRKFTLHADTSLTKIASTLPFTYTGADLYALCSDAMLKAITRRSNAVDQKIQVVNATRHTEGRLPISTAYFFDHLSEPQDTAVVVEEADFAAAARELVPSVSAKELDHYRRVKSVFEARDRKDADVKGKGKPRVVNGDADGNGQGEGEGDDFIIRTDALSLHDNVASPPAGTNGSAFGYGASGHGNGNANSSRERSNSNSNSTDKGRAKGTGPPPKGKGKGRATASQNPSAAAGGFDFGFGFDEGALDDEEAMYA